MSACVPAVEIPSHIANAGEHRASYRTAAVLQESKDMDKPACSTVSCAEKQPQRTQHNTQQQIAGSEVRKRQQHLLKKMPEKINSTPAGTISAVATPQ